MRGRPIRLRCVKCHRTWFLKARRASDDPFRALFRTGRTKPSAGTRKCQTTLVEVLHHVCGRTFWTSHPDAGRLPGPNGT